MKQSTKVTARQLALWTAQTDQWRPPEQIRQELTSALADLLLEALGVTASTNPHGEANEPEDHI